MSEMHRHGTDEVTCRQFVELVTDYVEDALLEDQVELVEEHLVMCDACKVYLEQMEVTVEAMPNTREIEPVPATTQDALLSAYRTWSGRS